MPEGQGGHKRGIFEDRQNFPGLRTFHIYAHDGSQCIVVTVPSSLVTERLWEFLEEWLDSIDPPTRLALVR